MATFCKHPRYSDYSMAVPFTWNGTVSTKKFRYYSRTPINSERTSPKSLDRERVSGYSCSLFILSSAIVSKFTTILE